MLCLWLCCPLAVADKMWSLCVSKCTQHYEPLGWKRQAQEEAEVVLLSLQEAYIADLDAKSGASLKLTILNPKGRIWTMVAGGGASVVYR